MSHGQGRRDDGRHLAVDEMHVRRADPAGFYAHGDLGGPWFRVGDLLQRNRLPGSDVAHRPHGGPEPTARRRTRATPRSPPAPAAPGPARPVPGAGTTPRSARTARPPPGTQPTPHRPGPGVGSAPRPPGWPR